MLSSALKKDGVYINVVTFPSPCRREDEELPAAVAIWEEDFNAEKGHSTQPTSVLPFSITTTSPQWFGTLCTAPTDSRPETSAYRQDANFEHMNAFTIAIQSAKKSYFESKYQSHSLHLRSLATTSSAEVRPRRSTAGAWSWGMELGHGAGAWSWGMELGHGAREGAQRARDAVCESHGQKLYTHLGSDYLGTVPVQFAGEDEKLSIGAMIYPYDSDETDLPPPAGPNDGAQQLGSEEWHD